MTIPSVTPMPDAPNREEDGEEDYAAKAFAYTLAWIVFADELNLAIDGINEAVDTVEEAALSAVNAPGTTGTSTTSIAIGTGGKSCATQTGKSIYEGMYAAIVAIGSPGNWMMGPISSYDSGDGSLAVNVTAIGGTGTFTSWRIYIVRPDDARLLAKTLVSATFEGAITEQSFSVVDGGAVNLNPANGTMQTWTLGASRTPTATFANGQSMMLRLAGAYAAIWTTAAVVWVDAVPPSIPASGFALVELWKDGGTLYGAWIGNVAS